MRKLLKVLLLVPTLVLVSAGSAFASGVDQAIDANQLIGIIVNTFDTPFGKMVIVVGSIAGLISFLMTQKTWALVIVAVLIASPFLSDFVANVVLDAHDTLTERGPGGRAGGGSFGGGGGNSSGSSSVPPTPGSAGDNTSWYEGG